MAELSFNEQMRKAALELWDRIMKNREAYVEAWVAATGLHPTECEIIEEHTHGPNGLTVRVYCRKKGKES